MKKTNFGYRNELQAYYESKLAEEANQADAIVGIVCLVLCLAYAVARYFGAVA